MSKEHHRGKGMAAIPKNIVKDNKNRLCSRIGSGADHPKNVKPGVILTDRLNINFDPKLYNEDIKILDKYQKH